MAGIPRATNTAPSKRHDIWKSGAVNLPTNLQLVLTEIKAATSRTKLAHETEVAFLKNLKMYIRKILSGYKK